MRGLPLLNYPAFDAASERIRLMNHIPISPADLDRDYPSDSTNLGAIVERDLRALLTCHAIAMLRGWQNSVGAKAELAVARFMQIKILNAETFQPLNADVVGIIMPNTPKLVSYNQPQEIK